MANQPAVPAATLSVPSTANRVHVLSTKLDTLETEVNAEIEERSREIHTAVLALVSRTHHFQVGAPGTAKSLLVRRTAARIDGLGQDGYFQWLLTQHSVPEEVFGPPSLAALERDIYKRNVQRKLPVAKIAFLDEIFKANASILNSLLTIMNERLFFNASDDIEVPLATVFAASNEIPASDELVALWDRLHFRHEVHPVRESSNFMRMLRTRRDPDPEKIISWDELVEAQELVDSVELPMDIYEALKDLRENLRSKGIEPTERRFVEALRIIQAESFVAGRMTAEINDLRPLRHVMWYRTQDWREVERCVLDLASPIEREATDLLEAVEGLEVELKKAIKDGDNPKVIAKQAVEVHKKLRRAKAKMDDLDRRCEESGRSSDALAMLKRKFEEVADILMKEGFGIPGEVRI